MQTKRKVTCVNKFFKGIEWVQDNISKPLQWLIYAIVITSIFTSFPVIIKSCNKETNYETVNANFIGEQVSLHGDNFSVQVLDVTTESKISIKDNKDSEELTEKQGYYIAVTLEIKQGIGCKEPHVLDDNDFKLKDHTGTIVPIGDILDCIDVTAPDFRADKGDSINSNASFSTRKAIRDYTWIGLAIPEEKEIVITVYFEMDSTLSVENTIMIIETDFYVGSGEINSAADIVLFKRKAPVKQ